MDDEKKEEEEKKQEENKEEQKKEEQKKIEEEIPEIVLKVDMHCQACARKVVRALKGFEGVEEVSADSKARKVVVKGKGADPIKVCERLQKKSGRKVELISPLPDPPEEKKEEPNEPKGESPASVAVTVVLNVPMHCEACAQVLQKGIRKIKGVESVETNLANGHIIVKGIVDPAKLVDDVYKKTKKPVSIVKEEEKKEAEKKEEAKDGEKKDDSSGEEEAGKGEDEKKLEIKRSEYWTSRYYLEYAYDPPADQLFSDENPNACFIM